jgi:2-polyprenyl-3-methyl-5-hydroxy-6-metoxy-1,4-benzoquinol methylase
MSGVIYESVREPAEYVARYNALMSEPSNRLRVEAVVRAVSAVSGPIDRIVDIACGGGAYRTAVARVLGRAQARVVPVDRQVACVGGYRLNHPDATPALADVTQLPFRAGAFDLALCLDIVEHLDDDVAFVRDVARLVRPGGWVLLSTQNSRSLEHLIGLTTAALRGRRWTGWDPTHLRFYDRSSLTTLVTAAGLEPVTFSGTYFVPFHLPARLVSWPLERLGFGRAAAAAHRLVQWPFFVVNGWFERVAMPRLATLGFGIVVLARKPGPE